MLDKMAYRTQSLPWVDAKIYILGNDFLAAYWSPFAVFVDNPETADFILVLNDFTEGSLQRIADARRYHKPIAWWTIEDPNSFEQLVAQAAHADFVFTTDDACISRYLQHLSHDRVFWLPLAASPQHHYPLSLAEDATEFVISANWYSNRARRWAVRTVVDPIRSVGHSMTLYCHESFMWPPEYRRYWRGETYYRTVAQQYRHGRVVIGLNNQRTGLDGRGRTWMTSMRTFEALACGKPFLSAHSDAYEQLGFVNGEHMVWVDTPADALYWAERLLGDTGAGIAANGRAFVLAHHTYGHRLALIAEKVLG